MRLGIKQTLGHLVNMLNGEARKIKLLKLEEEIEQTSLEADLNRLNDAVYRKKLDRLGILQYQYLTKKGHYYHIDKTKKRGYK